MNLEKLNEKAKRYMGLSIILMVGFFLYFLAVEVQMLSGMGFDSPAMIFSFCLEGRGTRVISSKIPHTKAGESSPIVFILCIVFCLVFHRLSLGAKNRRKNGNFPLQDFKDSNNFSIFVPQTND